MANKTTLIGRIQDAAAAFLKSRGRDGDMQTTRTGNALESWTAIARGLTPAKLARILNDADNGDIVEQHRLFSDVEDQDEHIFTELSKRRRALLTLDWTILPAPTADKGQQKQAERVAEEVRALFDSIPDYEDLILHMADAIGHGFAALEVEWGYDGKFHTPLALHHRPQHWFCLDKNRELRIRCQGEPEGLELEPLGWIIHQHRSKAGWFARHGLFRVLMSTFLYKQYARNGLAEFLEIHGLPMRVGKYPTWASEEEKKTLLNGLVHLGRDAAAIIPESMELEFHEAVKASESPYTAMMEYCEKGQSKAILGGTLTTQADGRTSTNALGKVHDGVRRDLLVSDAVQVAQTITRSLLMPLAVLNCKLADIRLAPWFRFDTAEPADLLLMAEALPKLAPVMQIPAAWAHEKCRIPLPEKGEEVLQAPQQYLAPMHADHAAEPHVALTAAAPEQGEDILDAAINAAEATAQDAMETMLAPLFAEVADGLAPDALMARLSALYPQLDTADLEREMAMAYFAADLWGRVQAEQEAKKHG